MKTDRHVRDWLGYGSFVDEPRRILYVATPKVACSSVKLLLRGLATDTPLRFSPMARQTSLSMLIHDRGQTPLPPLTAFSGARLQAILSGPGWFRFCVTRHPYERFFSVWRDKIFLTEPGFEPYLPSARAKFVEFQAFFERVMATETPLTCDTHWRAQTALLFPGEIAYTHIYDLADLARLPADLAAHLAAQGHHGAPPALPRLNQSWSIPVGRFLTPQVAAGLQEFYQTDFARFAYAPERDFTTTPARAAEFVTPATDAVFERNRVIEQYYQHARLAAGKTRLPGQRPPHPALRLARQLRAVFLVKFKIFSKYYTENLK
ncbi:sulfotransferase family 2 domain-containing protein [Acidocella sp.]|uniref:sulfotransferase family 2 domain-containing protein n=1 Tax=Acidocella sp. TaxID=50710 RepID=UPI00262ADE7C|nr:sulfotransferase family 2 domain-containing protein [Acidocella sp.]